MLALILLIAVDFLPAGRADAMLLAAEFILYNVCILPVGPLECCNAGYPV